MKVLTIATILILNLALQSSVFPHFGIFGVKPDSLLAIVISFALFNGSVPGAVIGLCGGLLQDILFSQYIGLYAFQYMILGYLAGQVYGKIYIDRILLPSFFGFVGYIGKELMMTVVLFFLRIDIPFSTAFFGKILPGAIYTAVVMIFIHYGIYKLHKLKYMTKKWRIGAP